MSNNGNSGGPFIFFLIGPYAFFTVVFSVLVPPLGFIMALSKYKEKKALGESGIGYLLAMILSVVMLIYFVVLIIEEILNA